DRAHLQRRQRAEGLARIPQSRRHDPVRAGAEPDGRIDGPADPPLARTRMASGDAGRGQRPRHAISLADKLGDFTEYWQPRTVAEFNGHDIMVVKAKGEFVWHKHDETDDLFLVLRGRLVIQLRDGDVDVGPRAVLSLAQGV